MTALNSRTTLRICRVPLINRKSTQVRAGGILDITTSLAQPSPKFEFVMRFFCFPVEKTSNRHDPTKRSFLSNRGTKI